MDIWILVVALLVISILLFVLSVFVKDDQSVEEKLSEFSTQQSQEFLNLKTRLAELEKEQRDARYIEPTAIEEEVIEETELEYSVETLSDLTKEEVIRLYSQGYTMTEIATEMALTIPVIQQIIDDYIENR